MRSEPSGGVRPCRRSRTLSPSLLATRFEGRSYCGGTAGFKDATDPVEGTLDTQTTPR